MREVKCECCGDEFGENPQPVQGETLGQPIQGETLRSIRNGRFPTISSQLCSDLGGSCTSNINTCQLGGGVARTTDDCPGGFCCVYSSTVELDFDRIAEVNATQTFRADIKIDLGQLAQVRRITGSWRKGGQGGRSRLCIYIDGTFRACGTECVGPQATGSIDHFDSIPGREVRFAAEDRGCTSQFQDYLDALDATFMLSAAGAEVAITRRGTAGVIKVTLTRDGFAQLSLLVAGAAYDYRASLTLGTSLMTAVGSFTAPAVGQKITVRDTLELDTGGPGEEPVEEEEETFLEKYGLMIAAGVVGGVVLYAATRKKGREAIKRAGTRVVSAVRRVRGRR